VQIVKLSAGQTLRVAALLQVATVAETVTVSAASPIFRVPARNLVFLIDVSGSMASDDKLPLVQHGLRMLTGTLNARDRVSIVVYAGASGLVLPPTSGAEKERIDRAIAGLESGGSTNGGDGIRLAYQTARESFIKGGVNRVVLATDGDFNVGVVDQDELVALIEHERESGVFLSVLGVGTGNLKDSTMEKLADRLIGYENRMLANEDFNDDRKDAGEVGAGHSVTAIYEIVPAGTAPGQAGVDALKYGAPRPAAPAAGNYDNEMLTVKLRSRAPDGHDSKSMSAVLVNRPQPLGANLGFASAVAEAGMLLRGSPHAASASFAAAIARARKFRGDDDDGYRAEFIRLMELAAAMPKRDRTSR
jgi:Ca-activated chloride channel family protein